MPNLIPVPKYTQNFYELEYNNNPDAGVRNVTVSLDMSPSEPSDGNTLVARKTSVAWAPAGQLTAITGADTNTPSIVVDRSVPGVIVLLGTVEDDNSDPTRKYSWRSIAAGQNGASGEYGRGPYEGVGPVSTQIVYISVTTPMGLMKPGKYMRDWLLLEGSQHALVDAVDGLLAAGSDLSTGVGRFDNLYEKTTGHRIRVHNHLDVQSTAEIRLRNSVSPSSYAYIRGNEDANTGIFVYGGQNKDIHLYFGNSLLQEASSVRLRNGRVEINGAQNIFGDGWMSLWTHGIRALGNDIPLYLRGNGTHDADVRVDVLQADTNNSGMRLKRRGTAAYDVTADAAVFGKVNKWNPNHLAVPYFNKYVGVGTAGTAGEEKIWEVAIPTADFDTTIAGGRFVITTFLEFAANANSKTWKVKVSDGVGETVLGSSTTTVNGETGCGILYVMPSGEVLGDTQLRVALETKSSAPAAYFEVDNIVYSIPFDAATWTFSLWLDTPTAAEDVICRWASVVYEPPVIPAP